MDKKLYKKPLVEEVDFDSDVNVMMDSGTGGGGGGTRPPRGGRNSATVSSKDVDEIYTDPFATVTEE